MEGLRANICHQCGMKISGNSYVEALIDGHPRVLHESCAKDLERVSQIFEAVIERIDRA